MLLGAASTAESGSETAVTLLRGAPQTSQLRDASGFSFPHTGQIRIAVIYTFGAVLLLRALVKPLRQFARRITQLFCALRGNFTAFREASNFGLHLLGKVSLAYGEEARD